MRIKSGLLTFVFLLASLIIAYAPEWGARYVSFFADSNFKIIGHLAAYAAECKLKKENSYCAVLYKIPLKDLGEINSNLAFGAGMILSATKYYCDDPANVITTYADIDNPGTLNSMTSTYQTVILNSNSCKQYLYIEAWVPNLSRRMGHIGGTVVAGNFIYVERVKRFIEFFNSDIRMLIFYIFALCILVKFILKDVFKIKFERNYFESYYWAWFGYLSLSSGFLQIFLPSVDNLIVMTRLSNFFSLVAHLMPGILYLEHTQFFSEKIKTKIEQMRYIKIGKYSFNVFVVAFLLFSLSPFLLKGFAPLLLAVMVPVFLITCRYLHFEMLIFSGLIILSCVKIFFNMPYLPQTHIASLFVAMLIMARILKDFNIGIRVTTLMYWARKLLFDKSKSVEEKTQELLFRLRQEVKAGRITFIQLTNNGGCKISISTMNHSLPKLESFERDEVPPVFAHTISLQEQLWHVQKNSGFLAQVKKGKRAISDYAGDYFCIFPVSGPRGPLGGIAITDYPQRWIEDQQHDLEISSIFEVLMPSFVYLIESQNQMNNDNWNVISDEIIHDLKMVALNLNSHEEIDANVTKNTLSSILKILSLKLSSFGFIGQLNSETRRVHILTDFGYSEASSQQINNGAIYAHHENQQGPLPLAINRKRISIIPDIRWLKGVLHPVSADLLTRNNTKSCCAVPIFKKATNEVWGVVWLERSIDSAFSLYLQNGLEKISLCIGELLDGLEQQLTHQKTKRALSTFVPQQVINNLIEGKDVDQQDSGILLMLDLRDSTRITGIIGADAWIKHIETIRPDIEMLAAKYRFKLQNIQWDAFYFTLSSTGNNQDYVDGLCLAQELKRYIHNYYIAVLYKISSYTPASKYSSRICLTFGDTSRGLAPAGGEKYWTIKGVAMAEIVKLESLCKKLPGEIFATGSYFNVSHDPNWKETGQKHPSSCENVYSLNDQNSLVGFSEIPPKKLAS